ncbi:M1 family metallopeptidase [Clostridium sp. ZS2-4]|uniref:M1 family metallopeptidase n=1 Tax=Clostridium sp. ZS2-4 TaxID=2987703 RepID=UPI00227CC0D5|nr:M1 family metallopeptidase [Clostridium sp. ZS2-4]MCY6353754.1 M1 family metallopeptidase [Clostridium sp. ZS2-4]
MKNNKLKNFTCFLTTLLLLLCIKLPTAFAKEGTNNYKINASFNESTKTLTVNETVTFKNTYNTSLKNIVFHLYPDAYNKAETKPRIGGQPEELSKDEVGDITITKVFVNDKKVNFTQDNQVLKLNLDKAIIINEETKVYIEFTFKLPFGTDRMGYFEDIYSFTNWYPILSIYDSQTNRWDENPFHPVGESNYANSSNYDVTLNVSKDMKVASTGVDKNISYKNDIKTINIKAENVRDFVFVMSPKFKIISKQINGTKVNSFYYEEKGEDKNSSKKRASIILEAAADSLDFFSNKFGKYPFEEYDVVETYLSGGAMEYPQLIQMGNYHFDTENLSYELGSYIPFEIEAAVHETGHQWWFSLVGNNEFKQSFLDESLTVYSTAYYFEQKYGKYCPAGTIINFRMYPYRSYGNDRALNTSVDKFNSWMDYSQTIYNKGPLAFEDLRQRVGDEQFLKVLQTYFKKYEYKNATIDGLLNTIEEVAGKDVRTAMHTAITSKNYSPENIAVSDEERELIDRERLKADILQREKTYGLSLLSIQTKAILGEKIYIVKPSNLSEDLTKSIDNFIENIKSQCENLGIDNNLIVKFDKDLTSEEMHSNNLILIGNPWTNATLNSLNTSLPISLTKYSLTMEDTNIYNSNVSGSFVAKNPYNKDKTLLVVFWNKDLNLENLIENTSYDDDANQFLININNKKRLSGRF